MNFVEPIRDKYVVRQIQEDLKNRQERNYIMFFIGLSSGLRISDIVALRIADIEKDSFNIREKKTGKQRIAPINSTLRYALTQYINHKNLKSSDFLIKSREGENKPISRVRAYQIMSDIAKQYGLSNIGTHTLRKTFGYHYYLQTKDVVMLQKIFNHATPKQTLDYIGFTQEQISDSLKKFRI